MGGLNATELGSLTTTLVAHRDCIWSPSPPIHTYPVATSRPRLLSAVGSEAVVDELNAAEVILSRCDSM